MELFRPKLSLGLTRSGRAGDMTPGRNIPVNAGERLAAQRCAKLRNSSYPSWESAGPQRCRGCRRLCWGGIQGAYGAR